MTFLIAFIIDLLVLALLAAAALKGMRSGFLRALMGILTYVIGFATAKILSPIIAPVLKDTSFIKLFAEKACGEYGGQSLNSAGASTVKDAIDFFFSSFGDMASDIKQILGVDQIGEATLSEIVAGIMASLISFIAVFIVVTMVLSIVVRICKKYLDKVKVLKKADTILGGVFGVFTGFFWAWIIAVIFIFMYEPLSVMIPEWFTGEARDLPLMIKISSDYNPFKLLFVGLSKIF